MARVSFRTIDPCDHVSRALDFVRKMGFTLRDLQVSPGREETFHVVLPRGGLPFAGVELGIKQPHPMAQVFVVRDTVEILKEK